MSTWAPVATAIAALIVALTPVAVSIALQLSNHARLQRVEHNTDGTLQALRADVAALRAQIEAMHSAALTAAEQRPPPGGTS